MNSAEKKLLGLAAGLWLLGVVIPYLPSWAYEDTLQWQEEDFVRPLVISVSSSSVTETPQSARTSPPLRPLQQVAINQATSQELTQLPGIGASLALRVIQYRQQKGPYRKAEDLLQIKGIGKKKLEKLKPFLKFD